MESEGGKAIVAEYLRPWKLATFAAGVGLMVGGALHYRIMDWDVPISLIMTFLTYLTAPWSMRAILKREWRKWPAAIFAAWFTVDGCYALYWHFKNPATLGLMREANFLPSLILYFLCGMLWLYRGSLADLRAEVMQAIRANAR